MTYSINGVSLEDKDLGWDLVRGSVLVLGTEYSVPTGEATGFDGVTALPSARKAGSLQFVMRIKDSSRSAFFRLMSSRVLTITDSNKPGWAITGRLLSSSPDKFYPTKDWGVDLFVVEVPEGAWRSAAEVTTPAVTPIAGSTNITLFSGISATVQDAIVRIKGAIQNPQLVDSSGAYLKVNGTIPANEYVRFDMRSGRAWQTNSDTWIGGTEVSGLVDFGGPRSVFEITPAPVNPVSPLLSEAKLTLTQTSFDAGARVQVRGRNAYIF